MIAMVYAFSDGSPIAEYLTFLTVLLVSLAICAPRSTLSKAERAFEEVASFTRKRSVFPEQGLVSDLRRIDVFRIIVGSIATCRYGKMLIISLSIQDGTTTLLAGSATLLAIFVMVGFLTPASVFILMSTANILLDNYLGASTLGTMVMSICLLVILLAPGGLTLSVDTALSESRILSGAISWLRRLSGLAHVDRILIAKLCGLFAYFCVCLYSVSWHSLDEAWTSGLVIAWVMLSPIANPEFSSQMWDAYNLAPWLFVFLARASMAGMFVWYVLVLPGLFLGRWLRLFVIFWGLLFFLISTFVLPLQFLGWYELAFWFVLFAQGRAFGSASGPDLAILFDDRCNLCDKTVKTLARLDVFNRIEFRPIRRNIEFANNHGVSLQQGLVDIVAVDLTTGNRLTGFNLYYNLTKRLVLLWPLSPLFWLGKVTKIGPRIYRFIADRRTKLFGVCEFSNIPDRYFRALITPTHAVPRVSPLTAGIVLTLSILAAAFLLRLPVGTTEPENRPVADLARSAFGAAPAAFGIHKINVFNTQDIAVFRFTNDVFLYHDGFDLASAESAIENDSARIEKVMSDQQAYFLTSHLRRMSRMDFGCDRNFIVDTLSTWRDSYKLPNGEAPAQDVIIEMRILSWPTADDLRAYSAIKRNSWPLCRFHVNLKSQVISDIVFVQEGLDESVRQKGFSPVIRADQAEAAINFPCLYAAAFSNIIATAQADQNSEFARKLGELAQDRFGRFGSDCFLETWQVLHKWPQHFPPDYFSAVNTDTCNLGLEVLIRLNKSFPPHVGPNRLISSHLEKGQIAAAGGDSLQCLKESRAGWDSYWRQTLQPSGALAAK